MDNEETSSEIPESGQAQNLASAGREELMVGALGFNFQYFKSIWALFRKPSEYFKAAKTPDWMNKFTPSLPLLMSIVALTMALEFFWGKPNGTYMKAASNGLTGKDGLPLKNNAQFMENLAELVNTGSLISTPVYVLFIVLFAWAFRAWGEKLPMTIRVRYMFAIVIPGSIIGVLSTVTSPLLSDHVYSVLSIPVLILMYLVTFMTALRGPYQNHPAKFSIARAFLLTLSIFIISFIAQVLSMGIATFINIDKIAPYIT